MHSSASCASVICRPLTIAATPGICCCFLAGVVAEHDLDLRALLALARRTGRRRCRSLFSLILSSMRASAARPFAGWRRYCCGMMLLALEDVVHVGDVDDLRNLARLEAERDLLQVADRPGACGSAESRRRPRRRRARRCASSTARRTGSGRPSPAARTCSAFCWRIDGDQAGPHLGAELRLKRLLQSSASVTSIWPPTSCRRASIGHSTSRRYCSSLKPRSSCSSASQRSRARPKRPAILSISARRRLGDLNALLRAGVGDELAIDHAFQHFLAVAADALAAQLGPRDLLAVDDRHDLQVARIRLRSCTGRARCGSGAGRCGRPRGRGGRSSLRGGDRRRAGGGARGGLRGRVPGRAAGAWAIAPALKLPRIKVAMTGDQSV